MAQHPRADNRVYSSLKSEKKDANGLTTGH